MAETPDPGDRAEMEPEDPALVIAARHALHDEELIAAFATDGDAAEEAARARGLVDRCQACSGLYADLVAIGQTLRATPNSASIAGSMQAPRDFRLSVETANRLRPGSVVVRLRDRLRDAVASFSRPVGMSMASLGVVGLLVGTLTLGSSAGIGRAPEAAGGLDAAGVPSAPAATGKQAVASDAGPVTGPASGPQASVPPESVRMTYETITTAPPPAPGSSDPGPAASSGPTISALIVAASGILLIGGVALLRLGARRREPIPGP